MCHNREMGDFRRGEGQRLVEVAVAWYVPASGQRSAVDIWLRLESTDFLHINVASDWTLRLELDKPYRPYEMPELSSRIELEADPPSVPFVLHTGERIRHIVETFDLQRCERKQAEFVFETASVLVWSDGGDINLRVP
jgi:hypothetical protein